MKLFLKRCVPFLLALFILASIGWYLLVYDRAFTRDMLISQARHLGSTGNSQFAAKLYDLAYDYTGKDEDVAIELANQYRKSGNYTKAEYTLTHAIADGGTVDLYAALCKTYVEQDKLQDAVAMLDSIPDPVVKQQIDAMRPAAPVAIPEPGFYSQYISLEFEKADGTLYYTTNREYPSIAHTPYSEPLALAGGETTIYALCVDSNGLVSPLTIVGYTISGVIEEATFADPVMEQTVRDLLKLPDDETIMTDMLWDITEFTIPAGVESMSDLLLLPYLEKLTIESQSIASLDALANLSALKELDLTGCRFSASELKVIAGLPKLERLVLSQCGLSTIADLAGAASLKYLDLSRNTLRNLEPLIPMTTLEELFLQHNAVTSLDALTALTNLTALDISYNSVTNISPLAACGSLAWLNAGNNQIQQLDGIDTFPALTHLYLNHNLLHNVDILGKCVELIELDISHNTITYILELGNLTKLVKLNCAYNDLYHFPIWPKGSALSVLDASHNHIASLNPLAQLEDLTYVYLDYNDLKSLDAIADCFRLVMVNAYGNDIRDVSKLTDHNIIVNYDPTN